MLEESNTVGFLEINYGYYKHLFTPLTLVNVLARAGPTR